MSLSDETQIELMKKDISYIKDEIGEMKDLACERHTEILHAIKELGDKKANKWVETAMTWAAYIVVGSVFAGLLALVIQTQ